MAEHSFQFQLGLKSIQSGEILVPPLRAYLANPEFQGFDIKVRGIGRREPDGRFHPSTHPSWSVRALWAYLVAPSLLMVEPDDPAFTLAVTAGSIWHSIIERALLDLGLLETNEVRFHDEATRSVGAADGLIGERRGEPPHLFEFKTYNERRQNSLNSVDDFIRLNPGYYLQCQEYMRMSGYQKMRFLLMSLTYPYPMQEFVIEYDMEVANRTADKYRLAIQYAEDGDVPMCGGCAKNASCPARVLCESASDKQIQELVRGSQA